MNISIDTTQMGSASPEQSSAEIVHGRPISAWIESHPLIERIMSGRPVLWMNANVAPFSTVGGDIDLCASDVLDAEARLERFAPYLSAEFPEVRSSGGLIESGIKAVPDLASAIARKYGQDAPATVLIKLDSHLPISGSVKARGGIYEVLFQAEKIALAAGLIREGSDYRVLSRPDARETFARHSIVVGSTGNLGLAIGLIASYLGFKTTVHMSDDARAWKKAKLRLHGVEVVEHSGDYGLAVEQGRIEGARDPLSHFVDDENSRTLFLGYSVAGMRLKRQLESMQLAVTEDAPLVVYLPCGVGGGPGGIAFGLKIAFGDSVHCFFAEPTQAPCMLLGMYTGLHDEVSVADFGLSNHTAADGLAVGRPSGFVGRAMHRMINGIFTSTDNEMFSLLYAAHETESLQLEPSALAGAAGFARLAYRYADGQFDGVGLSQEQWRHATHVIWATGGGMVPDDEYASYVEKGRHVD